MGKYKFTNKLMFAIIMRDPVACKKFIEMIFPERKVEKIFFAEEANAGKRPATVGEIAAEVEKTIVTGFASKSVRLDVLFRGDDTVYDIGRRVPRAKALHSWHETCLASANALHCQSAG